MYVWRSCSTSVAFSGSSLICCSRLKFAMAQRGLIKLCSVSLYHPSKWWSALPRHKFFVMEFFPSPPPWRAAAPNANFIVPSRHAEDTHCTCKGKHGQCETVWEIFYVATVINHQRQHFLEVKLMELLTLSFKATHSSTLCIMAQHSVPANKTGKFFFTSLLL